MSGPYFFAWTGGDPIPALELDTTGDVWSGSWATIATVWGGSLATTGDVLAGGLTLRNLRSTIGLVSGHVYTIKGTGIPSILGGAPADTTLTYNGAGGGTLNQVCTVAEAVSVTLTSSTGTTIIILGDVSPLVSGQTYDIAGSGIVAGSTFGFHGSNSVTLDQAATVTGSMPVTITSEIGVDAISNLASTTDLVSGLTYAVFGIGLPAGAEATYEGGNSLALLVKPTRSGSSVALSISKGKTYPDGGAFDPSVHEVEDEDVFAIDITHAEGGFAALTLDVRNPRVGLLAAGRHLWGWLSWRNAAGTVVPLFHGRLVGVPVNLHDEIVRLQFIARPNDFVAQKIVAANALRVLPYWDPVWLIDGVGDPDTVLETKTSLWHIHPTTLVVTTSDIIDGEDGTIDVAESEHFYDAMTVTYGAAPLRQVNVTGTVSWTQSAVGDVDLTQALVTQFQAAGSPYAWPKISSYTADGLLGAWPLPLVSLGGGWTIGTTTTAALVETLFKDLAVTYLDKTGLETNVVSGTIGPIGGALTVTPTWTPVDVVFTLGTLSVNLSVHYDGSRKRSEVASFVVTAGVQSILTDPLTADEEAISLSSAFVDQGVDLDGDIPLGDLRRNSYFPTDRGQQSLQYLMLLARAKLLGRARAVDITFACSWDKLAGLITCRKNVLLHDARLPGGEATGKVKSYRLAASESAIVAEVTIGCTVGYGDAITPAAGVDSYADLYSTGYDEAIGAQVSVGSGDLVYQSLDRTYVVDDDGVDFFNMTAETVVDELLVTGGPDDQQAAIDAALAAPGMAVTELGATFVGDVMHRHHGDGALSATSARTFAATGNYLVAIIADSRFTVTDPKGTLIGRGTLGTAFNAGGLAFTLAQGVSAPFILGDSISITVTAAAAGSVGLLPDPIGALSALPTMIALDLVPVTGGDFESLYVLKVLPLVVPMTINLEAAS